MVIKHKVCFLILIGCHCISSQSSFFSSFSGPLSEEVDEIAVPQSIHFDSSFEKPSFDFGERPGYSFGYGVHDPETGNAHKHEETRDGDKVRGEYSVVEPDGTVRTVVYTADSKHGFQATVHRKPPKQPFYRFPSLQSKFIPDYHRPEYDPELSSEFFSQH